MGTKSSKGKRLSKLLILLLVCAAIIGVALAIQLFILKDENEHTHTFGEWSVVKAATCKEAGVKTYTCTVCGETKTEEIPKLTTHTWNSGSVTKPATCKEAGVMTYTCTVCGETKTEEIPKLTTHTWNSGSVTKPATCKEAGVVTYTCTVCGETKTLEIPKLATHTWNSGVVTKPATCKEAGVMTYTCTVCGATKTEKIPKLTTHTMVNGVCTVCGYTETTTSAAPVRNGNKVTFGSYPQSEVTDAALKRTLNGLAGALPTSANAKKWTNYGYYYWDYSAGSLSNATPYMWYQDVSYGGERYRGVYFTQNRSYYFGSSSIPHTYQDMNGYTTRNVYWFKFEPLTWTVLSDNGNGTALIFCDYIIDSQAYQNECEYEDNGYYYIKGTNTYTNNYEKSTIRKWLNETFLTTAFTAGQIDNYILTTTVDNSARWNSGNNEYACANTQDKVFLLSEQEITNSAYGFNSDYGNKDTARRRQTTSYAQAQGAYTETGRYYLGNGSYWLRSPFFDSICARDVSYDGEANNGGSVRVTDVGVVPALQISLH